MIKYILHIYLLVILFPGSLFSQIALPGIKEVPDPDIVIQLDENSLRPGESGILQVEFTFPKGYHQTRTPETFKLEGAAAPGIVYGRTLYPDGMEENGVINYYGTAKLKLEFFLADSLAEGDHQFDLDIFYQLCDENGTCFFPESIQLPFSISVKGKPIGHYSILYYLVLAILGGFLLNLMPCVLPLLSVKTLNLLNQSGGSKMTILLNSLFYTGGILASFAGLAFTIILLKQSGQLLGWGFQFQNPYFLIILISVIFLFSLSLFEVFIILPPSSGLNKASRLSSRKGYTGSFFTGVFAVFVATPCTAPFLGAAMGFAFAQSAAVILSIMLATGLGLSLPFLILGFFPSFFRYLPKPGKWMDKFREIMAFLLMGTVVYLSATLIKQIGTGFITLLWYLLILALGGWAWGWIMISVRKKITRNLLKIIIGAFIVVLGFVLFDDFDSLENSESHTQMRRNWQNFSPESIEMNRINGETVFLAFSASWCTTCKLNERTVLYTDEADRLFEDFAVKLYKADLTKTNETAMQWIYSFNRAGVPLYVLYKKGEDPRILPEILSMSLLEDALKD